MTRRESLRKSLFSVSVFGDRDILIAIVSLYCFGGVCCMKNECGPGFLIQEET
jgi:hypothetical protein